LSLPVHSATPTHGPSLTVHIFRLDDSQACVANAYAERLVRSVRRECPDHFIIFTQTKLRRVVGSYIDYYNNYRPHQGVCGIPNTTTEQPETGEIKKKTAGLRTA
jgi:DNA primase